MRALIFGLAGAAVFALSFCGGGYAQTGGSFTDARDGKTYRTVRIGNLTWMAENLNHQTEDSWCYDDDDNNCEKYGRLYTWNAAMSACPSGWRLPSDRDWDDLMIAVGGVRRDRSNIAIGFVVWVGAGTKLKSKTDWATEGPDGDYIPGTDNFNFSALPGGYGWGSDFYYAGLIGSWWSAAEGIANFARGRVMTYNGENAHSSWGYKDYEFSVRCVRD